MQLDKDRQTIFKQATTVRQKLEEAEKSKEDLDDLDIDEIMEFFGEKVLDNIEPAELFNRFSSEELLESVPVAKLAGYAVERLVGELLSRPSSPAVQSPRVNGHSSNGHHLNGHSANGDSANGHTNGHSTNGHQNNGHKPKSPPVIAVVGGRPEQIHRLEKHFEGKAQILGVDKNKLGGGEAIVPSVDGVVTWIPSSSPFGGRPSNVADRPRELHY